MAQPEFGMGNNLTMMMVLCLLKQHFVAAGTLMTVLWKSEGSAGNISESLELGGTSRGKKERIETM